MGLSDAIIGLTSMWFRIKGWTMADGQSSRLVIPWRI
jgi:hypothetical protein